jgi:hypothetical protein
LPVIQALIEAHQKTMIFDPQELEGEKDKDKDKEENRDG